MSNCSTASQFGSVATAVRKAYDMHYDIAKTRNVRRKPGWNDKFSSITWKPQSLDTTALRRNCCQKIDMQPDWTSIHIWCSCCCCFFFTSISFHYIEINTDAVSFFWPVMVNWFYSNCFLRNIYAVQYTLVKQLLVYNMVNFTPIALLA